MPSHVLTYTLQQLDDNGNILARRTHSVTDATVTAGQFLQGKAPDTSQHSITLPVTQARQMVFYNTHTSAKFTITFTPYGGVEAIVNLVGPGGFCALFDPTAAVTGLGISSLKITSDTTGGTYELFIGG